MEPKKEESKPESIATQGHHSKLSVWIRYIWALGLIILLLLAIRLALPIIPSPSTSSLSPWTIILATVAAIVLVIWLMRKKLKWWKSAIIAYLLLLVVIGPLLVAYVIPPEHSIPAAVHARYPYYGLGKCDQNNTTLFDMRQKINLTNTGVKIDLGRGSGENGEGEGPYEGCYGLHVILPPECWPVTRCIIRKSQQPGDYASLWCDKELYPRPVYGEEFENFTVRSQSNDVSGGLQGCESPDSNEFAFFIEGRGEVWVAIAPNEVDP